MNGLSKANKPIFAKLLQRFNAVQGAQSPLYIGDVVTPVINVNELTQRLNSKWSNTTAVAAALTLDVPVGKQYIVKMASCKRANAGDIELEMLLPNGVGTAQSVYFTVGGTLLNWTAPDMFILNPGDQFSIKCQTGTSGSITLAIVYLEVDA